MDTNGDDNDDWCVECSDEELYGSSCKDSRGFWEPEPTVIVELYEKLAKGSKLKLEWKCPGRRSPSPEKKEEEEEKPEMMLEEPKEEERAAPTEFDFEETSEEKPITPRRTPGSARQTPKSAQHRVARMDNIMKDFMRHKKLGQEARASRDRERVAAATTAAATAGPTSATSPEAASGETTPQRSPGKSRLSPKRQ